MISIKAINRQKWVDISKAIGIFLVFYGHLIESQIDKSHLAFQQYKFIYSFHMPLFFFISGFFGGKCSEVFSAIKTLGPRRLIPVLFFNAVSFILYCFFLFVKKGSFAEIPKLLLSYLYGFPVFNVVTWFLICLFMAELLVIIILKYMDRKFSLYFGLILIGLGWASCNYPITFIKSSLTGSNIWYINECVIAAGFYLSGLFLFPLVTELTSSKATYFKYISCLAALLTLYFTFNLNTPTKDFFVAMIWSKHGELLPFMITSFAGIIFIISLSQILPANRAMEFIGRNTLILFAINGILLFFINRKIESYMPADNWLLFTFYNCIATIISIIICVPAVIIFNKYLPPFLLGQSSNKKNIKPLTVVPEK